MHDDDIVHEMKVISEAFCFAFSDVGVTLTYHDELVTKLSDRSYIVLETGEVKTRSKHAVMSPR